jgi:hypothetical protein
MKKTAKATTSPPVDPWIEALNYPPVRDRLEFFAKTRGEISHETLLFAIMDRWDMASEKDKYNSLELAMKFIPTQEGDFYETHTSTAAISARLNAKNEGVA